MCILIVLCPSFGNMLLVGHVGQPLDGFGVSKVVLSNNPNFKEEDYVTSWLNWEEYSLIPGGERLKVVDDSLAPLSYHLGCLGIPLIMLQFQNSIILQSFVVAYE